MGVSTDAILAYGYIWDDETELFPDETDWPEVIAKKRGHANPWDAAPDPHGLAYDERETMMHQWTIRHRAELDAWYKVKKDIETEYGCEIAYHGSDSWSVPIVCIAGHLTANRGYPVAVTEGQLAVQPEWNERLKRFVDELGIDVTEAKGPGWWLCSWWG